MKNWFQRKILDVIYGKIKAQKLQIQMQSFFGFVGFWENYYLISHNLFIQVFAEYNSFVQ